MQFLRVIVEVGTIANCNLQLSTHCGGGDKIVLFSTVPLVHVKQAGQPFSTLVGHQHRLALSCPDRFCQRWTRRCHSSLDFSTNSRQSLAKVERLPFGKSAGLETKDASQFMLRCFVNRLTMLEVADFGRGSTKNETSSESLTFSTLPNTSYWSRLKKVGKKINHSITPAPIIQGLASSSSFSRSSLLPANHYNILLGFIVD